MQITLELPDKLCENIKSLPDPNGFILRVLSESSDVKKIDPALHDLLRREAQKKIPDLKGKVEWTGNLAEMRSGRDFYDIG